MPNLVHVNYDQTAKSKSTNGLGMREMQQKAYEGRTAQYLLLKAPPASGKSRALMFLGLYKLKNKDIKKVIVAVPEKSIGNGGIHPIDFEWKYFELLIRQGIEKNKTEIYSILPLLYLPYTQTIQTTQ